MFIYGSKVRARGIQCGGVAKVSEYVLKEVESIHATGSRQNKTRMAAAA